MSTVIERETVHAAPRAGYSFLPCCDRTMQDLSRYDRISPREGEVTCGRLSEDDLRRLSGQVEPPVGGQVEPPARVGLGQNSEQLMFDMAVSVRSLCPPGLPLQQAFQHVQRAVRELAPVRSNQEVWPAALLVQITTRAAELAG